MDEVTMFVSTVVLAPVDKYAEIAYFMVSSPEISKSSIGLSLKVRPSSSASVALHKEKKRY